MVHIFIINPYSGSEKLSSNLREKLSKYTDIKYFVFNSRGPGDETELVRKVIRFFDDEKIRLYCCGGSGSLRNMINGIEDLSSIEVAFFPCGMGNEILNCFGEQKTLFSDLDKLINGRVLPVDYIKTDDGIAINAVTTGFGQSILEEVERYRSLAIFGKAIPYMLSAVHGFFVNRNHSFIIDAGNKEIETRCIQFVFANGATIGAGLAVVPEVSIIDGVGKYVICPYQGIIKMNGLIRTILGRKSERYARYFDIADCKKISIRRSDGRAFSVLLDGEVMAARNSWTAEIVHRGLKFIVPREVIIDE